MPNLALAFLTMKFALATLSWRESTTRIIEYDAIAREVTAGKATPSEQTQPFQTLLLTVQHWNGRSTVDSKISLKTKSKACLSIPTNSAKKSVWKNAWHVCKQVAERIDDAPVLKDYISSRVSESPEELLFFNASELNTYRNTSENSKAKIPGAACFSKIESFIEDHYVRGELFFNFVGMPAISRAMQAPHSVPGVPTTDGWDQ